MNVLEDEYHFVLVYPAYRYIRTTYLPWILLFMAKSPQTS